MTRRTSLGELGPGLRSRSGRASSRPRFAARARAWRNITVETLSADTLPINRYSSPSFMAADTNSFSLKSLGFGCPCVGAGHRPRPGRTRGRARSPTVRQEGQGGRGWFARSSGTIPGRDRSRSL